METSTQWQGWSFLNSGQSLTQCHVCHCLRLSHSWSGFPWSPESVQSLICWFSCVRDTLGTGIHGCYRNTPVWVKCSRTGRCPAETSILGCTCTVYREWLGEMITLCNIKFYFILSIGLLVNIYIPPFIV